MELNYDNMEQYTWITEEGELIIDPAITKINSNTFAERTVKENGQFERLLFDLPKNDYGYKYTGNIQVKKIKIPEGVTELAENLFKGFQNLEEVVLPKSLKIINDNAFSDCINLKKINISPNIERIGNSFEGCSKQIVESLPARPFCNGNGVLNNFYTQFIVDNTLIIPKGVKRIEELRGLGDFLYNVDRETEKKWYEDDNTYEQRIKKIKIKIENIEIPDSVVSIGDGVINDLRYLKKLYMPDSIIELGKNNFHRCGSLEKIRLSRNLKSINKDVVDGLRNSKIKCLILPDSIKEIEGGYSFKDDRFYDKTKGLINLDTITYCRQGNICRIYDSNENGTSQQISVTENKTFKYYSIHKERKEVQVEESKNTDKQITMSDVKNLDKKQKLVVSSDNIKKIGPFAFSQCPNLEEVYIEEGITEIGPGAFAECENLKKVHFPKSLKKISDYAFFDCDKLEELDINSKRVDLGDFCFGSCDTLQYAELPELVDSVGKNAFCECKKLKYVGGMKDVDIIDDFAFAFCDQLKISMPHKVKEIGVCAYINSGIKNWTFDDLEPDELSNYAFNETILLMPSSLEKIGSNAFKGCKGITQLHFNYGSKLKEIPDGAFYDCNMMSFIEFPDGMEKINDLAFGNCKLVEEIYLPDTIQDIGNKSFCNCKSLRLAMFKGNRRGQELAKPDAFDGCDNLEIVNFSDLEFNMKRIKGETFDVARKEKTNKTFSVEGVKNFLKNRNRNNSIKER